MQIKAPAEVAYQQLEDFIIFSSILYFYLCFYIPSILEFEHSPPLRLIWPQKLMQRKTFQKCLEVMFTKLKPTSQVRTTKWSTINLDINYMFDIQE